MTKEVEILRHIRQEHTILRSQYHGCTCPGDASIQGISNHDVESVISDFYFERLFKSHECYEISNHRQVDW